jgi:hypothetical protein
MGLISNETIEPESYQPGPLSKYDRGALFATSNTVAEAETSAAI